MGFLTGTLIVLGSMLIIGGAGAITHAATEDERKAAKKKALEAENVSLTNARNYLTTIKEKLDSAYDELTSAKNDFISGGHVTDGEPLANDEFTKCLNKLSDSKKYAKRLISDFDETIIANDNEINKL